MSSVFLILIGIVCIGMGLWELAPKPAVDAPTSWVVVQSIDGRWSFLDKVGDLSSRDYPDKQTAQEALEKEKSWYEALDFEKYKLDRAAREQAYSLKKK